MTMRREFTAALLAGVAAVASAQAASPTASVCRHEPRGERERFDAARARDGEKRGAREIQQSARLPDLEDGKTASALKSALRPGVARTETVSPARKLPQSWIGREIIFAPAARLAQGARLSEDAMVVLTGWTSARERDSAVEACGDRTVVAEGEALAALLGVRHRETRVRIRSETSVELGPF